MSFIKIKTVQHKALKLNKDKNGEVFKRKIYFHSFIIFLVCLCSMTIVCMWYIGFQDPILKTIICWGTPSLKSSENEYTEDNNVAIVSCYYSLPDPKLFGSSQLFPMDIDPQLCTHINIAFAQVKNEKIYLENSQYEHLQGVIDLKKKNPSLKILISVGGAGADNGFSEMVINHGSRKTFIKSIKSVLSNYSLDGIDLDWEFPALNQYQHYTQNITKRERQHFSQLLREIKAEYHREKKDYLLTVAVAAQQIIVDVAYDVDQINMYADYVNIMTYDFHTYTKFTPFTGLNSPLYARPEEELYLGTLNINYTVQLYKSKGLDPMKMVIGIPTYGHSFTLINDDNTKIGSPAAGFGKLGSLGFVNYPDICYTLYTYANITTVSVDSDAKVPYLYKGSEWVSFDNPQSVIAKAKYIRDNKLGGAMIYSLNADDFYGRCEELSGRYSAKNIFPLTISIKKTLDEMQNQPKSFCEI